MWRQIRGLGLAYSYNMIPRPNEALLYLTFYRATNIIGAYKEAKIIVVSTVLIFSFTHMFISCVEVVFTFVDRSNNTNLAKQEQHWLMAFYCAFQSPLH